MTKVKANFTFFSILICWSSAYRMKQMKLEKYLAKKQKQNSEDLHPTVNNRFMETLNARGFLLHFFLKWWTFTSNCFLTSILDSCTDTLKSTTIKLNLLTPAPYTCFSPLMCPSHWIRSQVPFQCLPLLDSSLHHCKMIQPCLGCF